MDRLDLKNLTKEELEAELLRIGEKRFRAAQMYEWMHKKLASSVSEMTNLSEGLRKKLAEEYDLSVKQVHRLTMKYSEYLYSLCTEWATISI